MFESYNVQFWSERTGMWIWYFDCDTLAEAVNAQQGIEYGTAEEAVPCRVVVYSVPNIIQEYATSGGKLLIEIQFGDWTSYGGDGRLTCETVDNVRQEKAGRGWRARFPNNPHGEDYGWGPLGETVAMARNALMAEYASLLSSTTEGV